MTASINIKQKCDRCGRDHELPMVDLEKAKIAVELSAKRRANVDALKKYITENFAPGELPQFFAVNTDPVRGNTEVVAYGTLCDSATDEQGRYCARRAWSVLDGLSPIEPKKPRAKKEKPAPAETPAAELDASLKPS